MPPAGRAPPCTRWGASRPPDPGITADAKTVPHPAFAGHGTVFASAVLSLSEVPRLRSRQHTFLYNYYKINQECAAGKRSTNLDMPHHRNRHPPRLQKSLKRKGEVWRGEGKLSKESFPFPLQTSPILFKDFRLVGRRRAGFPKRGREAGPCEKSARLSCGKKKNAGMETFQRFCLLR